MKRDDALDGPYGPYWNMYQAGNPRYYFDEIIRWQKDGLKRRCLCLYVGQARFAFVSYDPNALIAELKR